jgi:NAD-dependent SIR2 family protein deacetylase
MDTTIPQELIELLKQRRVIPFVGAGFSAGHGLPDWDTLLRQVCPDVPGTPQYEDIKRMCNGDYLQIAEYLFIKCDRNIGPLRHKLSNLLQTKLNCLESTPHVELINLNVQQIYTTNYDEIIEQTYSALGLPHVPVALPKHIASSNRTKTQIVKYHGDLRYDQTLVLTESSYYGRLEFESPMDLKFRSDLLGQSVLFIGYSFRDINIRIIWFKLMEMMKDVPEPDRPSSYIVRFEKNEVLEDLYRAVGIRTIYLDPEGKAASPEAKNKLLGEFMLGLSVRASPEGKMPHAANRMFVSVGLLDAIQDGVRTKQSRALLKSNEFTRILLEHAAKRSAPNALWQRVDETIALIARLSSGRVDYLVYAVKWAVDFMRSTETCMPGSAFTIIRSLLRAHSRDLIFELGSQIPWKDVWSSKLLDWQADRLGKAVISELENQKEFGVDSDGAYAADIAARLLDGTLQVNVDNFGVALRNAYNSAIELFPSITSIRPNPEGLTDLQLVLQEIEKKRTDDGFDDEIPF